MGWNSVNLPGTSRTAEAAAMQRLPACGPRKGNRAAAHRAFATPTGKKGKRQTTWATGRKAVFGKEIGDLNYIWFSQKKTGEKHFFGGATCEKSALPFGFQLTESSSLNMTPSLWLKLLLALGTAQLHSTSNCKGICSRSASKKHHLVGGFNPFGKK